MCELPLCSVCVGCDSMLSGFNEKIVVIVFFLLTKSGYCICFLFLSFLYISHYECVPIAIVREKMTMRIGGQR